MMTVCWWCCLFSLIVHAAVMVYGISDFAPDDLDKMLADFATIGVKVMFQVVRQVVALLAPGGNTTQSWGAFTRLVNRVQQSPAHLGCKCSQPKGLPVCALFVSV